ncbi:hypothetical protein [Enterococcus villorum]|nr:hypothetical protein [Enterococcus villorum]
MQIQCSNLLQGIKEKIMDANIHVDYAPGCYMTKEIPNGLKKANEVAENADAIIVTLGGSSARDFSTAFDKNGAALHGSQEMTSGENIDLAEIELPACQINLVK